jgi:hypothetical protein
MASTKFNLEPDQLSSQAVFLLLASRALAERAMKRPLAGSAQASSRQTLIYYISKSALFEERQVFAIVLMAYGTSLSTNIEKWKTWILSFACLCFPELVKKFEDEGEEVFKLRAWPDTFRQNLDLLLRQILDYTPNKSLRFETPYLEGLPDGPAPLSSLIWHCGNGFGMYTYCAQVFYLMGKKLATSERSKIETILRQYMDGSQLENISYVLTGDGQLLESAKASINKAWDEMELARQLVIKLVVELFPASRITHAIVVSVFSLLEYSGMEHGLHINAFLAAVPWAIKEIPDLKSAYDVYFNSIRVVASAEASLRPYQAIYYGKSNKLFDASAVKKLTAVATMYVNRNLDSSITVLKGEKRAKLEFIAKAKARGYGDDFRLRKPPSAPNTMPPTMLQAPPGFVWAGQPFMLPVDGAFPITISDDDDGDLDVTAAWQSL